MVILIEKIKEKQSLNFLTVKQYKLNFLCSYNVQNDDEKTSKLLKKDEDLY